MSLQEKIVVFTGAGVSAESGLPTFRDSDGLWRGHDPQSLATPEAWCREPQLVLDFYNMRRASVRRAGPNAAHLAIARLEERFDVEVVTQNIDDLHERAGSSRVLHLHGEIMKGRSEADPNVTVDLREGDIAIGDAAPDGHQLRPAVVWFGEPVPFISLAADIVGAADRLLVIGTSLTVWPAAGLVTQARNAKSITVVTKWTDAELDGDIEIITEDAGLAVPRLVDSWLREL